MTIGSLADVRQVWNGPKVRDQITRAAGKGIAAVAVFYTARLKEILSVPAPRKLVTGRRGRSVGLQYYRAAVAATRGAPPRKLSGEFRRRQEYVISADGLRARVGTNVVYARRHERGTHPYMLPTLERFRAALATIAGQTMRTSR